MTGVYTPWSICRDQRITLGGVSSLLPPCEPLDETQVVGFGSKNFTS